MKRFLALLLLVPCSFALAETESEMKAKALTGDYQAQRNLAYSYGAGWGSPGTPNFIAKKPVEACAWYRLIAFSDNPKVNDTDFNNEAVFLQQVVAGRNSSAWKLTRKIRKDVKL